MTDLGFTLSAANDMTAQVAERKRRQSLAFFQSIFGLLITTCLIAMAIVAALVFALPVEKWLHLGALPPGAIRVVLLLLCADVLVRLFNGISHAGFRANGDFALHTMLTNTVALVQNFAVWTVALAGYGPLPAAIAYFGVRLVLVPGRRPC